MAPNSLKLGSFNGNVGGRSLAWLGHRLPNASRANCTSITNQVDWLEFTEWVRKKYSKTQAPNILSLTRRFNHLLYGNLREVEVMPVGIRNNAINSLIVLSKFLGIHQEFNDRLRDYGVRKVKQDAFASFMRIYNNNSANLLKWYKDAFCTIKKNEQSLLKFLALSGIRKEEAITSFNKILELNKTGNLSEYYVLENNVLEHLRYRQLFLRTTKNVYTSIIPEFIIKEICDSQTVTYPAILKRLRHNGLRCRLNELREYFGTFMVRHGLIREEVDLLQGRIPPSIFIRHYWSPSFKELRDRTLQAITELEQTLNN
jgi:intergrase/recombinase